MIHLKDEPQSNKAGNVIDNNNNTVDINMIMFSNNDTNKTADIVTI